MIRLLFITLFTTTMCKAWAQPAGNCDCGAIIDHDFKGKIFLYNAPHGHQIKALQNDSQKEDFLMLRIDNDYLDYFHVEIFRALTPASKTSGWIKKRKEIGTYARNYEQDGTLNLYSKPDTTSHVQSVVSGYTNQLYNVTKCSKKWAYVIITFKGHRKEGWLQPDKQCNNPYSTCN